jgi:hypothetical protein
VVAAVVALAGCGSGAAEPEGPTVTQRITRDFGSQVLAAENRAPLEGRRTLLRLLRAYERVGMGDFTGSVAAIDGLRRREEEPETAWVRNVNGIEADESSDKYRLYPGDVVQWDYRDWYVTLDTRATVGAFPQTFTRGVFGRLFPTTVECADPFASACIGVKAALQRAGVTPDGTPTGSPPPPAGQPQRARILVGPWRHWRGRPWPHRVDKGPSYSGVFARFTRDAETMRLLDWNTRVVRNLGAGAGLVAAIQPTEEDLVWLVTGIDNAGVDRAARALNSRDLRDAFAVAVTADGVEKLPLRPR